MRGFQIAWNTDTGSDINTIGPQHLALLGGFPENLAPDHDKVRAANGQRLVAMGTIEATLFSGSKQHHTLLHVYNDLDDALLSCRSLVALGFLPGEWPKQVASIQLEQPTTPALPINPSKSDIDKIRYDLLAEFADVFVTDSLQPMTGPAMDIQLQPDATASCIYTAHPIPYAFCDQVKTQLGDMVANGIIEPVSSPSEWCHTVVIVPKKSTNEKRLTVDFKKLTLCARHVKWWLVLDLQSSSRSLTHATDTGRYRLVIKHNLLRHSSHRLVVTDSCETLKDSYQLVMNLTAVPTQLSQTSSV